MEHIDLSGIWSFVADLDPKYHLDTNVYPFPPYAQPGENRRHWLDVPVPGVWQRYGGRYDIFEGVCWFSRVFTVTDLDKDVCAARLRFGGVNYLCRVFLNGTEIGGHEGGYTEFALDCRDALVEGANQVAVMVDNRSTSLIWPPVLGYFNYGGIHRGVTLEIVRGAAFGEVRVSAPAPDDRRGAVTVTGTVIGDCEGLGVSLRCEDSETRLELAADGTFTSVLEVDGVEPWTPDAPNRYRLEVGLYGTHGRAGGGASDQPRTHGRAASDPTSLEDTRVYEIGFRSIGVTGGKVMLNGRETPLRGICYVYDSPVTGLTMTEEQIRRDVGLMKTMGCNAVRCHYPMDGRFYSVCDELGLLVWIEPPVYCYHPRKDASHTLFTDGHAVALAEKMIEEMIAAAQNHPSVAIYGIGNECNTEHPDAFAFFEGLASRVRALDPTRLVSYAALYGNVGRIAELVDVLGVNSYWGWYDKVFGGKGVQPEVDHERPPVREPIDLTRMHEMLDTVLAGRPGTAIFLTEFGADSVPGSHSASRDLWSEEYHADLLTEIIHLATEYPQIVGTFPFCFSDYRDPSKTPNGYWDELNLKGMVDYHRNTKLAFAALESAYRGLS